MQDYTLCCFGFLEMINSEKAMQSSENVAVFKDQQGYSEQLSRESVFPKAVFLLIWRRDKLQFSLRNFKL